MSNKKAFFLGLFATFAVILPIYLIFAAISLGTNKTQAVELKQGNVPMAHPGAQDAKTVLIICTAEEEMHEAYVLVRFDALENEISVAALFPQTVVLSEGQGITLTKAQKNAGPAQAAACIEETLGIKINNYIKASAENIAELFRPLGIANLLLANYISEDSLSQLKLSVPGIESVSLSTQRFALVMSSGLVPPQQACAVRTDGYLAFLRAGHDTLFEALPIALKKNADLISTDISASDIFDYERVLKFLSRAQPDYSSVNFSGAYSPERFDLDETVPQTALDYFA